MNNTQSLEKKIPPMYILNIDSLQSTALITLKKVLNANNVKYEIKSNTEDLHFLFTQSNTKNILLIENTNKITFKIENKNPLLQIYQYPKKQDNQQYQNLPNAGTVIKMYMRLFQPQIGETSEKIQLRTINKIAVKEDLMPYSKLFILAQFDRSHNKIYEKFLINIVGGQRINYISTCQQISLFNSLNTKFLIIAPLSQSKKVVKVLKQTRICLFTDIAIFGIQLDKFLFDQNIVIATMDQITMLQFLAVKGFKFNLTKIQEVQNQYSSENENHKIKKSVQRQPYVKNVQDTSIVSSQKSLGKVIVKQQPYIMSEQNIQLINYLPSRQMNLKHCQNSLKQQKQNLLTFMDELLDEIIESIIQKQQRQQLSNLIRQPSAFKQLYRQSIDTRMSSTKKQQIIPMKNQNQDQQNVYQLASPSKLNLNSSSLAKYQKSQIKIIPIKSKKHIRIWKVDKHSQEKYFITIQQKQQQKKFKINVIRSKKMSCDLSHHNSQQNSKQFSGKSLNQRKNSIEPKMIKNKNAMQLISRKSYIPNTIIQQLSEQNHKSLRTSLIWNESMVRKNLKYQSYSFQNSNQIIEGIQKCKLKSQFIHKHKRQSSDFNLKEKDNSCINFTGVNTSDKKIIGVNKQNITFQQYQNENQIEKRAQNDKPMKKSKQKSQQKLKTINENLSQHSQKYHHNIDSINQQKKSEDEVSNKKIRISFRKSKEQTINFLAINSQKICSSNILENKTNSVIIQKRNSQTQHIKLLSECIQIAQQSINEQQKQINLQNSQKIRLSLKDMNKQQKGKQICNKQQRISQIKQNLNKSQKPQHILNIRQNINSVNNANISKIVCQKQNITSFILGNHDKQIPIKINSHIKNVNINNYSQNKQNQSSQFILSNLSSKQVVQRGGQSLFIKNCDRPSLNLNNYEKCQDITGKIFYKTKKQDQQPILKRSSITSRQNSALSNSNSKIFTHVQSKNINTKIVGSNKNPSKFISNPLNEYGLNINSKYQGVNSNEQKINSKSRLSSRSRSSSQLLKSKARQLDKNQLNA